ncbi:hypothetical protein [Halomarina rubra]|uniref:Outer membrane lipoprotein-sorting protein n=1 Tax=Halomarina rubra TaxID=2071873 RepID=A0ABD6AQB0_9EURY|nr:hypothetical protein [Halomarina rubra]
MSTRQLRRALPVVAMALLLVTAGCSLPGGGDGTPTAGSPEPTTGTTTPSATPTTNGTPGDVSIAGVEDGRVVDASALAAAHEEALAADSMETRLVQDASIIVPTGPNSSQVANATIVQQVVAEAGGQPYRYRLEQRGIGFTAQVWGNDSVEVTLPSQAGETQPPRVGEPQDRSLITSTNAIGTYLDRGNYTVTGTTTEGNRTLVTLEADELTVENDTDLFVRGASDFENYRSTVVVSEDGVVRSLEITAEYTLRGERRDLSITYEVLRQGNVSFEQPEWARTALASTTATEEPVGTATPA